jgi:hypothetical protein
VTFFRSHNFFIQTLNWTFCICSFDQPDERNTMVKFILHFDYFDKPDLTYFSQSSWTILVVNA